VREVHVLGVGATSFAGSLTGGASAPLAREAAEAALADAGVAMREVDAVVVAGEGGCGLPELAARELAPEAGTATLALQLAWEAVASAAHDVVLCVGHGGGHDAAAPVAALAREATAYMEASGATERTFALVAAKNRLQGMANPRAHHADGVDAAAVLRSAVVAWPLRELMIAGPASGAAAVLLAARGVRRSGPRAPLVRACVLVGAGGRDGGTGGAIARAAGLAYRRARVGPEDVDLAEVHDASAAAEVAAYEALQFAPDGQGPDLVDSGFTTLGGVLPVNPSGGALARGDSSRAGALAQVCEITWQLRGEAGRRQVAGARVGLAVATASGAGDGPAHVGLAILGP